MNKKEINTLADRIINEKPKIYKYIMDKVDKKMVTSFTSFLYKDNCYCPKCKKVVLGIYNKKFLKTTPLVECCNCGKIIKVDCLSNRIKTQRIKRFIFDVLECRNDCLVNQTYCISHYYNFNSGRMKFKESLFKLGSEVYDLKSDLIEIRTINLYSDYWGNKFIFDFKDSSRAKRTNRFFYGQYIAYHSYEDIEFLHVVCFKNQIKKKFLNFFDIKQIKNDFNDNYKLIPFLRCLNVYPKLETLYKLENYTWSDNKWDFFNSVLDCLKKRKKYEKYNYHLFKDIYTSKGKKVLDFNYYTVNIKIGKPYIGDKNLLDYLAVHNKFINRDIVNYFSKQCFFLYDDYIKMAKDLKLDLKDKKNLYPKDLKSAHDELVFILNQKQIEENKDKFFDFQQKYSLLEFEESGYKFYLPQTILSFKTRGKLLNQCLFSSKYHERYLNGNCIIVFIDCKNGNSRNNLFTLELNKRLGIVQLHGFNNDIDSSNDQKHNLSVVREILNKRLELLEIKKGQVVYKNNIFHSSGKNENANAF